MDNETTTRQTVKRGGLEAGCRQWAPLNFGSAGGAKAAKIGGAALSSTPDKSPPRPADATGTVTLTEEPNKLRRVF